MDGTKFAKMLSDKHLFELDRLAYKYSVADVREFSEISAAEFCPSRCRWWIFPADTCSACRIMRRFPPRA